MRGTREQNTRLLNFARRMRTTSTDAERKLWTILRSRLLSGYKFRRQHPMSGYILDFYCIEYRLAIELDGGQHADPENKKYDEVRTIALQKEGLKVIRFWDNDALKHPDVIASEILKQLEQMPSPRPSPGVPGEGAELT